MLLRLLLSFTAVSLVELYVLVWIAGLAGFWPTLGIVLVTAILGASLSKREGLKVLREWQAALTQGRAPKEGLTGAFLVLVAGLCLIMPGVLTDVVGVALLIPPLRRWVGKRLEARFFPAVAGAPFGAAPFGKAPMAGSVPFAQAARGRAVRVEAFRVQTEGGSAAGQRIQVVDHGPVAPKEPPALEADLPESDVLEGDVVVDRRGRIVHRNE